jgi:thiol-disulfide isomerase/thioredoxin
MTLVLAAAMIAPAAQEKIETLEIGATAPDFELKGIDGKMHSLDDYKDAKVLMIVFTANHCPTAQAYEERIKKIVDDYKGKGVTVVAISSNDPQALRLNEMGYTDVGDTFEDMKIRAEHKKFNFPYLYDGDTQEVAKAYGPTATPHVFIFDADRKLRYVGRIDNAENPKNVKTHDARDALAAVLAGKPVSEPVTRAFGCSMKWSSKRQSVKDYMAKLAAEPVSIEPISPDDLKALIANDSQKVRLINIWATWCGPCREEMPALVEINRMYRHRPFELIMVDVNAPDNTEEVLPFLKKIEASNRNVRINTGDRDALAKALGEEWNGSIPYTVLVAPGGKVLYRHHDAIDPLVVKRKIVEALGPRG